MTRLSPTPCRCQSHEMGGMDAGTNHPKSSSRNGPSVGCSRGSTAQGWAGWAASKRAREGGRGGGRGDGEDEGGCQGWSAPASAMTGPGTRSPKAGLSAPPCPRPGSHDPCRRHNFAGEPERLGDPSFMLKRDCERAGLRLSRERLCSHHHHRRIRCPRPRDGRRVELPVRGGWVFPSGRIVEGCVVACLVVWLLACRHPALIANTRAISRMASLGNAACPSLSRHVGMYARQAVGVW